MNVFKFFERSQFLFSLWRPVFTRRSGHCVLEFLGKAEFQGSSVTMEGDWLSCIRTLVKSSKSDVDRICVEELEKCREIAGRARNREQQRQRGQNELLSKRKELERIESLVNQLTPELDSLKQEDAELGLRLHALQSDLILTCQEKEELKQKLQDLTAEVVDMERDKENKGKNLKKEFGDLMKIYKTYKRMLDMRIEWVPPDVYKIWFSARSSGKESPPDIVFGSIDRRSWEVLDVRGDENLKDELNDDFVEYRSVQRILLKARHLCLHT